MIFNIEGKVVDEIDKRKIGMFTRLETAYNLYQLNKHTDEEIATMSGYIDKKCMASVFRRNGFTSFANKQKVSDSQVKVAIDSHIQKLDIGYLCINWNITMNRLLQRMRMLGYSPSERTYSDNRIVSKPVYATVLYSKQPLHYGLT